MDFKTLTYTGMVAHTERPSSLSCCSGHATAETAASAEFRKKETMTIETGEQPDNLKRVYMSRAQLASYFNMTERAISKIIKRKKWHRMKNMGRQAIYSILESDLLDEGDGRRKYGQSTRAARNDGNSNGDASD
ncbi:hypothetical protein [Ensifer canadensis]|uniref:hypothetical protein n=1 Tax=Ensifer canadensis TaxID=555315 RepID=UPI0035E3C801